MFQTEGKWDEGKLSVNKAMGMISCLVLLFQVPPNLLVKHGVSVCRSVQEQGQFVVIFPRSYTSSLCTGYSVAESVYFAPRSYLTFAETEFQVSHIQNLFLQ